MTKSTVPIPEPGSNDVLVEVEATSVGRTVYNVINGNLGDDLADLPRIPGHEVIGRVTAVGDGVSHVGVDDRVAAYFHLVCGSCEPCQAGKDSLCENHAGWVSVDIDGGYAEYARLPAGNAIPISASIDAVEATAIPDSIATPYHVANKTANISPGESVMVLGAGGGVGIHMVQMAQYFGGEVTAVDLDERKLQECRALGTADTLNTSKESLSDAVDENDERFDVIIDFTGDIDLLEESVGMLGAEGRLVNLTTFGNTMALSPRMEVARELQVVGSRYCSKYELRRAARLVEAGHIKPIVSEVVGFDGVVDLLESIAANEVTGRGAMTPT